MNLIDIFVLEVIEPAKKVEYTKEDGSIATWWTAICKTDSYGQIKERHEVTVFNEEEVEEIKPGYVFQG